jgi:phage terminase large subunit-like protein
MREEFLSGLGSASSRVSSSASTSATKPIKSVCNEHLHVHKDYRNGDVVARLVMVELGRRR